MTFDKRCKIACIYSKYVTETSVLFHMFTQFQKIAILRHVSKMFAVSTVPHALSRARHWSINASVMTRCQTLNKGLAGATVANTAMMYWRQQHSEEHKQAKKKSQKCLLVYQRKTKYVWRAYIILTNEWTDTHCAEASVRISQVSVLVRQRIWSEVIDFTPSYSAVHLRMQQWNN